ATGPAGADGATGPAGATGEAGPTRSPELLDDRVCGWLEGNRSRLNQLLLDRGIASPDFDPALRPVAVFDWDNTVLKNDIGDATLFWLIKHDKILQPAGRDWSTTSQYLSAAARADLNSACDGLADPGQPLPTSANPACADAIVRIYDSAITSTGLTAWSPATTLTMNSPYAWVAQLLAGYGPEEVRGFAREAFVENAYAPIGARQTVGSNTTLNGYVRIYEPIEDLIRSLQANGFDVWILTASPQFVVDAISELVGIQQDRVVGIRNVIENGRLTANLQGCGTVADGENTLITFDEGKRCWINKVIYHLPAAEQLTSAVDAANRPVFVAGDSDTDIAMLKDATDVKLVINRNKTQIMCNAYANVTGNWLVQPMFIAPRGQKSSPYACSTALAANGAAILDELGHTFPADLPDTVYELPTCP
ncbi:haloacid dehalogenase-like hydrolase, partial [Myxococcota bacterium]|nr:haloacid dehalogenase-like hydrolase [Myxococcota bacterium]